MRRERWLKDIEAQWGPAPGKQQSDGSSIFVLGAEFGNVFVGIQPAFGYEGDPMRLLFEKGFAPTHAFAAFYRWMREEFGADALLHFGTHGALEFMPGKQTGLSGRDWPDRLIGDMPNIYLYAANNPSEGAIAKRRSAATLISYLTPPIAHAGLYRGLIDLKTSIERWRGLGPEGQAEAGELATLIQAQAARRRPRAARAGLGRRAAAATIEALGAKILELEYTLIPHGLHVVGEAASVAERADFILATADSGHGLRLDRAVVEAMVNGRDARAGAGAAGLPADAADGRDSARRCMQTDELLGRRPRSSRHHPRARWPLHQPGARRRPVAHAGDPAHRPQSARLRPVPHPERLCGGRRRAPGAEDHRAPHGRRPAAAGDRGDRAVGHRQSQERGRPDRPGAGAAGRRAALRRLRAAGRRAADRARHARAPAHRRDRHAVGHLPRPAAAADQAAWPRPPILAASADEPVEQNFIRKHALAHMAETGCDLETAALRVFGNAEGAYGSNVNHLIENGRWDDEDELADTYERRKSFAYGRSGVPAQQSELLQSVLSSVDLAYQNLDSVELGVTTVDHYFDTLGGISRAVRRAKGGKAAPVYIGDQTRGEGVVRTLTEQVAIESRTRMLNPKWYEGMLTHGYEGVRQIDEHVRNTMGWSATTGEVEPWVYQQITQTFLLDPAMRERLAALNPTASHRVANRLIEAHERRYWTPSPEMLAALRSAGEELEDRVEGVGVEVAA